jgi:hypothetical protein
MENKKEIIFFIMLSNLSNRNNLLLLLKCTHPDIRKAAVPLSTLVETGKHRQVQGVSQHKNKNKVGHYFTLISYIIIQN